MNRESMTDSQSRYYQFGGKGSKRVDQGGIDSKTGSGSVGRVPSQTRTRPSVRMNTFQFSIRKPSTAPTSLAPSRSLNRLSRASASTNSFSGGSSSGSTPAASARASAITSVGDRSPFGSYWESTTGVQPRYIVSPPDPYHELTLRIH